MATTKPEIDDACGDARLNIVKMISSSRNSIEILRLAEAYAWLTIPGQPHGGGNAAPKP